MSKKQPAWVNWTQYVALRTAISVLHSFSVQSTLSTAAGMGALFCRYHRRHLQRAIDNVTLSFPEWSAERVEQVALRSIQNMFQVVMVDAVVMPRLVTRSSWQRRLRVGHLQKTMERLIRNQPTIFITGHIGNWELLGYSLAVLGYPLYALARPLDNPLINDWVMGIREARGMRIITKWGAVPALQQVLRTGGRAAFIADQNAGGQGLFVPFFGRLASSYKSIGLLAMQFDASVVCGFAKRTADNREGFYYEMAITDVFGPAQWSTHPDPLFYLTARYRWAIEQMVRDVPEQYFWMHRIWRSRPRHERLDRPFPPALREKIELLPWISADGLQRVVEQSARDAATLKRTGQTKLN